MPHHRDATSAVAFAAWDKRTELQIYENGHPWGPFRLVHDERPWGGEGLLAEGDLKVAAIAAAAGFSGAAHIHRAFRRTAGTTPRRYRAPASDPHPCRPES